MPSSSCDGLDDRRDQAGRADAVGAHRNEMILAVRAGHLGAHRLGILVAEVENVADLDAARRKPVAFGDRVPGRLVMHLVGRGVGRRPALDDAADLGVVAEVGVVARHRAVSR